MKFPLLNSDGFTPPEPDDESSELRLFTTANIGTLFTTIAQPVHNLLAKYSRKQENKDKERFEKFKAEYPDQDIDEEELKKRYHKSEEAQDSPDLITWTPNEGATRKAIVEFLENEPGWIDFAVDSDPALFSKPLNPAINALKAIRFYKDEVRIDEIIEKIEAVRTNKLLHLTQQYLETKKRYESGGDLSQENIKTLEAVLRDEPTLDNETYNHLFHAIDALPKKDKDKKKDEDAAHDPITAGTEVVVTEDGKPTTFDHAKAGTVIHERGKPLKDKAIDLMKVRKEELSKLIGQPMGDGHGTPTKAIIGGNPIEAYKAELEAIEKIIRDDSPKTIYSDEQIKKISDTLAQNDQENKETLDEALKGMGVEQYNLATSEKLCKTIKKLDITSEEAIAINKARETNTLSEYFSKNTQEHSIKNYSLANNIHKALIELNASHEDFEKAAKYSQALENTKLKYSDLIKAKEFEKTLLPTGVEVHPKGKTPMQDVMEAVQRKYDALTKRKEQIEQLIGKEEGSNEWNLQLQETEVRLCVNKVCNSNGVDKKTLTPIIEEAKSILQKGVAASTTSEEAWQEATDEARDKLSTLLKPDDTQAVLNELIKRQELLNPSGHDADAKQEVTEENEFMVQHRQEKIELHGEKDPKKLKNMKTLDVRNGINKNIDRVEKVLRRYNDGKKFSDKNKNVIREILLEEWEEKKKLIEKSEDNKHQAQIIHERSYKTIGQKMEYVENFPNDNEKAIKQALKIFEKRLIFTPEQKNLLIKAVEWHHEVNTKDGPEESAQLMSDDDENIDFLKRMIKALPDAKNTSEGAQPLNETPSGNAEVLATKLKEWRAAILKKEDPERVHGNVFEFSDDQYKLIERAIDRDKQKSDGTVLTKKIIGKDGKEKEVPDIRGPKYNPDGKESSKFNIKAHAQELLKNFPCDNAIALNETMIDSILISLRRELFDDDLINGINDKIGAARIRQLIRGEQIQDVQLGDNEKIALKNAVESDDRGNKRGPIEEQVEDLCKHIKKELNDEQRAVLATSISEFFDGDIHPELDAEGKTLEDDSHILTKAIKKQYPGGDEPLEEFLKELDKKMGDSNPLKNYEIKNERLVKLSQENINKMIDSINAYPEKMTPTIREEILHELLMYQGLIARAWHRKAHALYEKGETTEARKISQGVRRITAGIEIHPGAEIGERFMIDHGAGIVVGETAKIGNDVMLYHHVTLGNDGKQIGEGLRRHPKIGNNVSIYTGAVLLGPIEVDDDVVIGAGAHIQGNVHIGKGAQIITKDVITQDIGPGKRVVAAKDGKPIYADPDDQREHKYITAVKHEKTVQKSKDRYAETRRTALKGGDEDSSACYGRLATPSSTRSSDQYHN